MRSTLPLVLTALAALCALAGPVTVLPRAHAQSSTSVPDAPPATLSDRLPALSPSSLYTIARRNDDLAALETFRPGYAFWQHIFTIPDGFIAFGSGVDGRLLAVFPAKGDWIREGDWKEPGLSRLLDGQVLARNLDDRRDQVAALLEPIAGPIVHNPTRGQFVLPNARRYGRFLREWGAIYERFGVAAEIGLAQAMVESGLNPTRRSPARAVGFCQWLARNWQRLSRLSPHVIESHNQTTQAPYCAAYLTVLATKYGSFIPALSEHHSGGTNVGRIVIIGSRLGGEDARGRYFLGSQFARELREISLYGYRDIYRTYGPRSYLYAEMVFGNAFNVTALETSTPQTRIFAMRTTRPIPMTEITRRTRLSIDEVRRFNPALLKAVPARSTLYLPSYVSEFGRDVSFWHRPASRGFDAVLNEFVRLDVPEERWDDPSFEPVLRGFQRRFRETDTEEGVVMATVLGYVIDEAYSSGRGAILTEYRTSEEVLRLFERGVQERDAVRASKSAVVPSADATGDNR
jgi:hypothetical protein